MAVSYAALVAEWTTLTGSATVTTLAAAQTIPANLATLAAITVTGSIPTLIEVPASAIFNCLVYSEFEAITAAQQTLLMQVLAIQGNLMGGSASPFIAPMFGALAAKMPNTITALTALAQALPAPWWSANGYTAPTNVNDLIAAGIVTQALAHQAGLV